MLAARGHRNGHRNDGLGCDAAHHLGLSTRIELGRKPGDEVDRQVIGDLHGAARIQQARDTRRDQGPERTLRAITAAVRTGNSLAVAAIRCKSSRSSS